MITEEIFKQGVKWVGLPTALLASLIIVLDFGLAPMDTVAMHAEKEAVSTMRALGTEHVTQMLTLIQQTKELQAVTVRTLNALKEICFNTAQHENAKRRCGAL